MKIKLNLNYFFRQKKIHFRKKNKYFYWLESSKIKKNSKFDEFNVYNGFTFTSPWLKKKYFNKLYVACNEDLYLLKINKKKIKLKNFLFDRYLWLRNKLYFFILLYRTFFINYYRDLLLLLIVKKQKRSQFFFFFFWIFTDNQRLFLNFQSLKKKTFFFLSNGMFLKYFEKKKSLKKKKLLKTLIARYLRKLLLIVKFKNTISVVKKTPSFFLEMFNILNSPIVHKFFNPFSKKIISDDDPYKNILNSSFFIFYKNIDFAKNKKKKRGRIKRKITRKIFLTSAIVD